MITFELALESTPELVALWDEAMSTSESTRGAADLRTSVGEGSETGDLLSYLIDARRVWVATYEGTIESFVILEGHVIQAIYVAVSHRRRGIARSVLHELAASASPPRDAWALPGDRATKSLYESVGWKARLLTMHAE